MVEEACRVVAREVDCFEAVAAPVLSLSWVVDYFSRVVGGNFARMVGVVVNLVVVGCVGSGRTATNMSGPGFPIHVESPRTLTSASPVHALPAPPGCRSSSSLACTWQVASYLQLVVSTSSFLYLASTAICVIAFGWLKDTSNSAQYLSKFSLVRRDQHFDVSPQCDPIVAIVARD